MYNAEGKYLVQLINIHTGNVDEEREIKNIITDDFLRMIAPFNSATTDRLKAQIILSTTKIDLATYSPNPKQLNVINTAIPATTTSGSTKLDATVNSTDKTLSWTYNFTPVNQTYNSISLFVNPYSTGSSNYDAARMSYVSLTTSLTQTTDQYLKITYTLKFNDAIIGSTNTPNNLYVNTHLSSNMYRGAYKVLSQPIAALSQMLPADNINNVGTAGVATQGSLDLINSTLPSLSTNTSLFGQIYGKSNVANTDWTGPWGPVIYYTTTRTTEWTPPTVVIGQSNYSLTPQFGRIFKHIGTRRDQRFSDGTYAPFSRGTIVTSGTPTNKVPTQLKAIITKSGKAVDVDDGEQGRFKLGYYPFNNLIGQQYLQYSLYSDINKTQVTSTSKYGVSEFSISEMFAIWYGSNNYTYSIQRSKKDSEFLLCKWNTNTVESSIPINKFTLDLEPIPSGLTYQVGKFIGFIINNNGLVYIAFTKNLFTFDCTTETITELNSFNKTTETISEIAYDSKNDMVYVGGSFINSKTLFKLNSSNVRTDIDLSAIPAYTYTYDANNVETETIYRSGFLNANEMSIGTGQLTFDNNGVMIKGGGAVHTGEKNYVWILDNTTNKIRMISNTLGMVTVPIIKDNKLLFIRTNKVTWEMYRVDFKIRYKLENYVNISGSWSLPGGNNGSAVPGGNYYGSDRGAQIYVGPFISDSNIIIFGKFYKPAWNESDVIAKLSIDINTGVVNGGEAYYYTGGYYFDVINSYDGSTISSGLTDYTLFTKWHNPNYEPWSHLNVTKTPYMVNGIFPVVTFKNYYIPKYSMLNLGYNTTTNKWDADSTNDQPITTQPITVMDGVSLQFTNTNGVVYDQQFVLDEDISVSYGLLPIKDNLQQYSVYSKHYYCNSEKKTLTNFTLTNESVSGAVSKCRLPEALLANFRDVDCDINAITYGIGMKGVWSDDTPIVFKQTTTVKDTLATVEAPAVGEINVQRTGNIYYNTADEGRVIKSLEYVVTYY